MSEFAVLAVGPDNEPGERCNTGMSIRTSPWPPGVPRWVDLTVPDVDGAEASHAAVLGWSYQDTEAA